MELDQTHVVIRKRLQTEIADLALVMLRRYPSALLVGFSLGALPWIIANGLLLYWIPWQEAQYTFADQDAAGEMWRCVAWMTLLVVAEVPAAGVWTTFYLGQAVFEKQPTWQNVRREINRNFLRWFLSLGVVRLPLPIMIVCLFRIGQAADPSVDLLLYLGIWLVLLAFRSARPFLPEILLLEQCPRRSKDPNVVTLSRRMTALHRPMAGELTARMLTVGVGAGVAAVAFYFSLTTARGLLFGRWQHDEFALMVLFPLSLWLVGGWSVFFRLLNYLDTRIRLEGWEVELSVRAERLRQFGDDAPVIATGATQ
ncbi:hypothetical protein [Crateriforma conspicua]|uniref:Uncharacterized protein n=1 Tax=Crateriforma conspicua TaxID=2527996 RepID=A0A5C5Y743_9PLAN|nr:hypothetical protein [Crateriforma conspicua]TWT69172.1 hypothetical protein Pan14r_14570 [Crateriforma conspicua]